MNNTIVTFTFLMLSMAGCNHPASNQIIPEKVFSVPIPAMDTSNNIPDLVVIRTGYSVFGEWIKPEHKVEHILIIKRDGSFTYQTDRRELISGKWEKTNSMYHLKASGVHNELIFEKSILFKAGLIFDCNAEGSALDNNQYFLLKSY